MLRNFCNVGRAFIKLEVASIYIIDFLISYLYVTKDRSYIVFVTLSTVRLCLHFFVVVVAHFGAVKALYNSVMIAQHLGSDSIDNTKPLTLERTLRNRYQFKMLAKMSVFSLVIQGIFVTIQIIQQGSVLFNPNSLDYPSIWLDSYFTFLALPQLFQLWCQLGFGSGLYYLFSHCILLNENNRDMKLAKKDVESYFNIGRSTKDDNEGKVEY
jgi:hypothetical protein